MNKDQAQVEIFNIAFNSLPGEARDTLFIELAKNYSEEDLEDLIDRVIISLRKNDSTSSLKDSLEQRGFSLNDI